MNRKMKRKKDITEDWNVPDKLYRPRLQRRERERKERSGERDL